MFKSPIVIGFSLLTSSISVAEAKTYDCKLTVQNKKTDGSWSTEISPVKKFTLPAAGDLHDTFTFEGFVGEISIFTDPKRQPGGLLSVRKADQETPEASNYADPLPEITDTRLALENEIVVMHCDLK